MHDAILNTFVSITWKIGFHVVQKSGACSSIKNVQLLSSTNQYDIYQNGVHTLVNLITIKPTQVDILVRSYSTQGFIASKAIHTKERSYCDQHPTLVIEVFGYLHKQGDAFLHDCVNVVWSLKGPKHPPLSILVTYFYQKILITLQNMQTSSILSWVITIGLATSQHPLFQDSPPSPLPTCSKQLVDELKTFLSNILHSQTPN